MSVGVLGPAGTGPREITIPDGAAGRRLRLVVLLICSSSLFITYLARCSGPYDQVKSSSA
ncbi:MAG TPA: hypothetical protein VFE59_06385 [Trebonia sp.]|jgi:hypothetical protein|nr:hypothetical protein [Trebonia sp.]